MSEHALQTSIIAECDLRARQNEAYGRLFAVPNGGARNVIVARKLKAEGVRRGVPDLLLPLRRHGYVGMAIELKAGRNRPSAEQTGWLAWLAEQGWYTCVVTDDAAEAMRLIIWYVEGEQ